MWEAERWFSSRTVGVDEARGPRGHGPEETEMSKDDNKEQNQASPEERAFEHRERLARAGIGDDDYEDFRPAEYDDWDDLMYDEDSLGDFG